MDEIQLTEENKTALRALAHELGVPVPEENLISKHVKALQRIIASSRKPPEAYVIGSWEEWMELRNQLLIHQSSVRSELFAADVVERNFLLCGVPCVPIDALANLSWDHRSVTYG